MLKRFSVEGFKNFKNKVTLELSTPCNYEFNKDVVSDGCLTKGIIYGKNGSGKSNLGLAVFDLVLHLTDKEKLLRRYDYYLSLDSVKPYAEFEYVFSFYGKDLVYRYQKSDAQSLLVESLVIDGKEVLHYDFSRNDGITTLEGAGTLNLVSDNPISRVKYVRSNAILTENDTNRIFSAFVDFVDRMLLFYSLDERGYQGFRAGTGSIAQGIIGSGKMEDFETFLKAQGVDYKLVAREVDGKKKLYCKFKNNEVDFFSLASTGTSSLALFYYWYITMQSVSLSFIDEFDAFYHFELSEAIVKLLYTLKGTQVLLTTHNTDLMTNDLLRPDCYFLLNEKGLAALSTLTEKELRQAHNLQKMYKAGAFDE